MRRLPHSASGAGPCWEETPRPGRSWPPETASPAPACPRAPQRRVRGPWTIVRERAGRARTHDSPMVGMVSGRRRCTIDPSPDLAAPHTSAVPHLPGQRRSHPPRPGPPPQHASMPDLILTLLHTRAPARTHRAATHRDTQRTSRRPRSAGAAPWME